MKTLREEFLHQFVDGSGALIKTDEASVSLTVTKTVVTITEHETPDSIDRVALFTHYCA